MVPGEWSDILEPLTTTNVVMLSLNKVHKPNRFYVILCLTKDVLPALETTLMPRVAQRLWQK